MSRTEPSDLRNIVPKWHCYPLVRLITWSTNGHCLQFALIFQMQYCSVICKICIIPNTSCRKFCDNCFLKGSISPLPLMFPQIAIEHMFHSGTHECRVIPSYSTGSNYLILNEINWSQIVTDSFGNVIANCNNFLSSFHFRTNFLFQN